MDTRTLVLTAALGLVMVMLWQAWIDFQLARQNPAPGSQVVAPQAEDVPQAPRPVAGQNNTADTLPQVPGAVPAVEAVDADLIRVTTDLMAVQIDPQGGDIVRVALLKHPVSVSAPDQPFVLMNRQGADVFVAQSGLIGDEGREYPNHYVAYTTAEREYRLGGSEVLPVALSWTAPDGVVYRKTYRFSRDSYRIEVEYTVDNLSAEPWQGFFYAQLKQTEREFAGEGGFLGRLPSYNGVAIYTAEDQYDKVDYGDIADGSPNWTTTSGWIAMLQHYFVAAWLPGAGQNPGSSFQFYTGVSENLPNPEYRVGFHATEPMRIEPGAQGVLGSALFVGPKEQARLSEQGAEGLKLTVDYGWLTPIADPLFWLLSRIHNFVHNWGFAIVLLTLLVKLVFLPLSAASYKSMEKMKKLQPRMKTLKERYADDKQRFQQEVMKLYKAERVNPAGGCLPILVQIPVFIALYWVLLESVELRQAHFILWLNDLSRPDPFYVLPLLMGASMFIQQKLNPAPLDPMQQKIMTAMPIVFTVFFLWFPAGLVLYWVVNNVLSIGQQALIARRYRSSS